VTHPNNPFTGATAITIGRYRTVDAGPRQYDIETNNLRGVLGLRGKFNDWDWEVAAQRARSESDQTGNRSQGWVRTDFLQNEINAGRYNPFGATSNPQSVIDAITTSLVRQGKSRLAMYDGSISGSLFDLPAGKVKMAAGAEWRNESISDIPDDQFRRGLIFGTEAVEAAASRDSWATYVEFAVPVLSNLELSLAGRYDHYEDFGDTTNPKVAVRYSPIESLALRASWGKGFRAPSLAQVGLGPSQESQFFKDFAFCRANGISDANCPALDYNTVFSGNPDLKPEKSDTLNIGAAWKATDSIEFSIDYWDIEQKAKIDRVPLGFLLTFCTTQISDVCTRAARVGNQQLGELQSVASTFINIGKQTAKGIDLSGYYGLDLGGGRLAFQLSYSHLLEFERVELNGTGTGFVTRALEGEYEYPKDRATFSADFGTDTWGVFGIVNYIGPFQDTPDINFDGTLDYDLFKTPDVDAFTTINLQFRYTGFNKLKLTIGADNLFDEKPPFAVGDGDSDIYGYVQSQHNPLGRVWNAKAIVSF
jgi:iron complex outermembrane receptor protein